MLLYVVRHAAAAEQGEARFADDSLRELTSAGIARFERLICHLVGRGFSPQLIVSSPYVRCLQTAEIMLAALGGNARLVTRSELAPGEENESLADWANEQGCEALAWVGHAPDVEVIVASLIGDGAAAIRFGKGTIAAVEFADGIAPGAGQLRYLITPRLAA